ncbi:MAG: cytochrome P460 family protein, partial [Candidatus Eremiobacterota bacterium]
MKRTLLALLLAASLLTACNQESQTPPAAATVPGLPFPLPSTLSREEFQPQLYAFLSSLAYRDRAGWRRDKGVRDTGPFLNGTYFGTHPAVRTYYSPEVYTWLKGGRQGELPDGAMIVKEMYPPPAARYAGLNPDTQLPMPTWTCMIKDSAGAQDGWYWSYFDSNPNGSTPPVPQPVDDDDPPFSYPNSGFGSYCVQCHASAD